MTNLSKQEIKDKIFRCYSALATYGGDQRLKRFYTNALRQFQKQLEK